MQTFGFSWDGIESRRRDDEPPIGNGYLLEITNTTEIKVGKNGRRGFAFGCKVVDGEHVNKMIWQWVSLEESNIEWTKGLIETLGREDILRADGAPADLTKTIFQADIVDRGGYKNLINIVAQSSPEEAASKRTAKPAPQRPTKVGARR